MCLWNCRAPFGKFGPARITCIFSKNVFFLFSLSFVNASWYFTFPVFGVSLVTEVAFARLRLVCVSNANFLSIEHAIGIAGLKVQCGLVL